MQPAPQAATPSPAPAAKHPWRIAVVALLAVVAILGGLDYLGFFSSGDVKLMVHDAPCSQCTAVWVTFNAVSVHESDIKGSGWTDLNTSGATFNLEALNGSAAAKVLAIDKLAAGHYEQIRLGVSKVVVNLTGGPQVQAMVVGPTADFNGQFTVAAGGTTTLNIDVNLDASLHVTGASATFTPNIGTVDVSGP